MPVLLFRRFSARSTLSALSLLFAASIAAPSLRAADSITLRHGWRVQSSAKVNASGDKVSLPGFSTKGWYPTSAPNTVFAVLVENGVYKNPYFGMNLRSIPGVDYPIGAQFANIEMKDDSPYAKPWWYRLEFDVPAAYRGKQVWLAFHGINYRADIWVNGKKVAGSDQVAGAFRRYRFDVTNLVHPGSKNVVAVEVSAPKAGELGITFVDWNPTPPDKDMGLWQEVVLTASGAVAIRHPFVDTKLDLPSLAQAHLTVRAEVENTFASSISGELHGSIAGEKAPIAFSQPVELAPGEKKEVVICADSVPGLNISGPRLWWPYQMGEPYLHELTLRFVTSKGAVTDTQHLSFGIVQTDSELTSEGARLFKINGKPILIRGAGYTPDMMLRLNLNRRQAEFRYVKEMGLNTIRLEGKLEDDEFMDRADRDGILIMAGWCCCDAWEKWGKWSEENKVVSVESLRSQMLRLRSHPSLLVWLNGSDNPPPPERENAYLEVEKETHWPKPILSSATAKVTQVTGHTGVKMSGPYDYVSPNYWLLGLREGGALGFNSETSPGPAVPPLEELKTMFPPDKLWPINEFWDFHAGGGQFKNIDIYKNALDKRYGEATSAADFAWKSQAATYEGERAMFEAYGRNKYHSTGVIQWMLNNSWPGLIWHLYSYDLLPAGGYFGTRKALEPVHVQYSYDDRTVAVVNGTQLPQDRLKVVAKLYDTSMNERFSRDDRVDVAADGVTRAFAIPEPEGITTTYFLNLQLFSDSGKLLSRNFYWLSTKPDVLDFSKTEWYYTPLSSFADFTALQHLPKAAVKASIHFSRAGHDEAARVTVENAGSSLAFLVRLRLLNGAKGKEILPVFWDDNYLCLLPGEKREVGVKLRKSELGSAHPVLAVDGFNVLPVTVR